jgi:hypothetical protein
MGIDVTDSATEKPTRGNKLQHLLFARDQRFRELPQFLQDQVAPLQITHRKLADNEGVK